MDDYKEIGIFKDGGTKKVRIRDKEVFIDKRINSNTKGAIYSKYPNNKDAIILALSLEEYCNKIISK